MKGGKAMLRQIGRLGLLLSLAILLVGCGGPRWLPKLFQCRVKVLQEGKPLEEAKVQFHTDDPALKQFTIVGTTGTDGIVNMMTQTYPGVPKGKYKITVSKYVMEVTDQEQIQGEVVGTFTADNGKTVEIVQPSYVPPILEPEAYPQIAAEYEVVETTPVSLEITKKMNEPFEIEVGPIPAE